MSRVCAILRRVITSSCLEFLMEEVEGEGMDLIERSLLLFVIGLIFPDDWRTRERKWFL